MTSPATAFITGGARRIGRRIALVLAEAGWDIALHYNASRDDAEQVQQEIEALGRRCVLFQADLACMEEVHALIPRVMEAEPQCRALINNASIFERAPLMVTEVDFLDRLFHLNFKVPFFLTRAFARQCERGCVINLLDTKIEQKRSNYFAYTLSKKALFEFTRMAAHELAPGIRVNGVCPGLILPPEGEDDAYLRRMAERIPLRRHGSPNDVAAAVRFLLENEFITGECIYVDGGERLNK